MQRRTVVRYSMAFKRQVVSDMEAGRFRTMQEAGEHYGIKGPQTVRRWLMRFGRDHLTPKVVRVEMPDEADQIRQLKKQIRQLEQALGKATMKNALGEAFLEIACERIGVDVDEFKKKAAMKGSTGPGNVPEQP